MATTLYQNPTLFTESVSAVTATNTVQVGTIRWEGGNQYTYVYNDAGASSPGYFVQLTSGGSGYSVTASMTTGDAAYGVVQNATLTTGTYGWVMRIGRAKVQVASGGVSASKLICVTGSSTAGDLSAILVAGMSGATGGAMALISSYQALGRTLGSAATAGSILAAVHFPS